ncbi:MAG: O-methyltransferase [Defluviitaleaceae bacterium]|nr:O-methyltransferase [Defluviitaleaceae bacterium]
MEIVNSEVKNYLSTLLGNYSGELETLRDYAEKNNHPIIPKDVANFLKTIIHIKKPTQILEIGTCIGFSSIFMALNTPENCHITTIEKDEGLIKISQENFEKFSVLDKVTLLEGDALEILSKINTKFDFIFLDAAKGQYINMLPDIIRILKIGGILIADDVLIKGKICVKNQNEVEKRWRTIYNRMCEFLHVMHNTDGLESTILPLDDGVLMSVKTKEISIL